MNQSGNKRVRLASLGYNRLFPPGYLKRYAAEHVTVNSLIPKSQLAQLAIVCALLATIYGTLTIPLYLRIHRNAYRDAASAQLGLFCQSVHAYHEEHGSYPTDEALFHSLISKIHPQQTGSITDPWGSPYGFQALDSGFTIWSCGPDGIDGTQDDIARLEKPILPHLSEPDPVSNAVSFRGNQYQITSTGRRLVLQVSPEGGVKKSRTLRARLPALGRVREIRLARWTSGGGLCAVIELQDKRVFSYACVTLAAPEASEGYDSGLAVFHRGSTDFAILAVNGTFDGDSVLAMLGVIDFRHKIARVVSRGLVYLDDCPAPPSRGSISEFDSKGQIDPALKKLYGIGD